MVHEQTRALLAGTDGMSRELPDGDTAQFTDRGGDTIRIANLTTGRHADYTVHLIPLTQATNTYLPRAWPVPQPTQETIDADHWFPLPHPLVAGRTGCADPGDLLRVSSGTWLGKTGYWTGLARIADSGHSEALIFMPDTETHRAIAVHNLAKETR